MFETTDLWSTHSQKRQKAMTDTAHQTRNDVNTRSIVSFVLLTFGITWGVVAILLISPQLIPAFLGPMGVTNPVYILAVWAPGLVGMGLIAWHTGFAGLRRYFGRLLNLDVAWQWWAFVLLFIGFVIKVPSVPLHTWLPDAHVQAPTAGSVVLAAILLKMGGYGFLRFSLPMFPLASHDFAPLIFGLSVIAIIYTSLVALM